ncbi:hypothetical protein ACQEU8_24435 [Streptomyces sp. CA-250714]|uniref:hypothetical protein n=1 Tax=Streptomyces sp. CA-250714 TaxID=3240060 RepID=UPI003D948EF3
MPFPEQVRASFVVTAVVDIMKRLGTPKAEMELYRPVIQYVETMVRIADAETEAAQHDGPENTTPTGWRAGIEDILSHYGLRDSPAMDELNRMAAWADLEISLMTGTVLPTTDAVRASCYERCSDITLLLAVAHQLAGLTLGTPLARLLRHVFANAEILDDLRSYDKDVREGAFNTYQSLVWMYGTEQAADRLRCVRGRILRDLLTDLRSADTATLLRFGAVFDLLPAPLRAVAADDRLTGTAAHLPQRYLLPIVRRRLCGTPWFKDSPIPKARPTDPPWAAAD